MKRFAIFIFLLLVMNYIYEFSYASEKKKK